MSTLVADNISKSYGAHSVLAGVSLAVTPGTRVGLLGPNGIGKTTLLRILAGLEAADSGSVVRTPPSLSVGYLPQETEARPGETIRTYLARRVGLADAEARMEALAARLEAEPQLAAAHGEALELFLELGGEDFDARARAATADVGLRAPLDRTMGDLSGGEGARAALASILVARFDVLLLDEPTNDLDFAGLGQLEQFLDAAAAGVVLVSHDRAFLDGAVTRVLEFEAETGRTKEYAGGFAEYERARAAARSRHEATYEDYVEERGRFEQLLRARRGQARAGGKQANRRATHALSSKVRAAERRLERLEEVEKPWKPWELRLKLAPERRSADVVARLAAAVVQRDGFRLGPLDLELHWGERLALLGENGAGKTTLLHAVLGRAPLAGGTRYVGPGVVFGILDQRRELFADGSSLLTHFRESTALPPVDARTLLSKFNVGAEAVERPTATLSPGERTRAALALFAGLGVNCLVLDEPTNHLDLEAIEELEAGLQTYSGTVVLVTHDRRLLERFEATRMVELSAGRLRA